MRRVDRAALTAVPVVGLMGACSAEGDIDTSGDGVKIEGDADADADNP